MLLVIPPFVPLLLQRHHLLQLCGRQLHPSANRPAVPVSAPLRPRLPRCADSAGHADLLAPGHLLCAEAEDQGLAKEDEVGGWHCQQLMLPQWVRAVGSVLPWQCWAWGLMVSMVDVQCAEAGGGRVTCKCGVARGKVCWVEGWREGRPGVTVCGCCAP